MSENVPANIQLDSGNGSITFASEVLATIAGLAATEVEGVTSMGSAPSGLSEIWSRKQSGKSLTRGVRVEVEQNTVNIHLTIMVDYGSPVPDVARNIQENVKKAIETMSGLTIGSVDIYVQAVSFEREKSTAVELEMKQRLMLKKHDQDADDDLAPTIDKNADGDADEPAPPIFGEDNPADDADEGSIDETEME